MKLTEYFFAEDKHPSRECRDIMEASQGQSCLLIPLHFDKSNEYNRK